MGSRRLGRRERVPVVAKTESVTGDQSPAKGVVGSLVGQQQRRVDLVAQVDRHADAQQDS